MHHVSLKTNATEKNQIEENVQVKIPIQPTGGIYIYSTNKNNNKSLYE